MKKRTKLLLIVICLMIMLLFPIKQTYKDGGTKSYTSLTYKIIKWNTLDSKKETDFYIFPFNFKPLDEYKEKIDKEKLEDLSFISDKDVYSLNDTAISFIIVNNTNKTLYTHVNPTLEIKTDNGWKILEKNDTAGFCGNKDVINDSINLTLLLSWYDNLKEGDYRVSYNVYSSNTTWEVDSIVSKEFSLQSIESSQKENSVNCDSTDFEMSLFSDKYKYTTNEKIKIWATLKYIGSNDKVRIWHASSYMLFSITDGKDFNVEDVVYSILKSSVLEKNKLYHYDYKKSGAWAADGPNAAYWESFYKEKELLLPEGEYTIILNRGFSLSSNMKEESNLTCELKIKVIQYEKNIADIAFNYLAKEEQNIIMNKNNPKIKILDANDYEKIICANNLEIRNKKIYTVEFSRNFVGLPNNTIVVVDYETKEVLGLPLLD